jgi:hypothetical protein
MKCYNFYLFVVVVHWKYEMSIVTPQKIEIDILGVFNQMSIFYGGCYIFGHEHPKERVE